ncbi:MAG: DUF3618 domain-containing protein [Gemmatimonadaceae bacterium]
MAETTADVRRDIELTRERMSDTLTQLEQKLNIMQVVKDNPWPALAVAVAAGALLAGSRSDVKAAAATVGATRGASNKVGEMLDDAVATLVGGVHGAFQSKLESWVNDLKSSLGATNVGRSGNDGSRANASLGSGNGGNSFGSSSRNFDASSAASAGTMGAASNTDALRAD